MADYSVTFSELDALLQSLPANTVDTPYEIEITEITNAQCVGNWQTPQSGTIQYVLQNNQNKFVSLIFAENSTSSGFNSEYMFFGCTTLVSIETPASVVGFRGNSLFQNCTNLVSADLSKSSGRFSDYYNDFILSFFNCLKLEQVKLPYNVKQIGQQCFQDCKKLKSITLPSSVVRVGGNAFMNCTNLTTVIFKHSQSEMSFENIGNAPFYNAPASVVFLKDTEAKSTFLADYASQLGLQNKTYYYWDDYNDVTFSNLDTLLQTLPENTADTPYKIRITEITNAQCTGSTSSYTSGTLQYILRSYWHTKYVSLSFSDDCGLTAIGNYAFYNVGSLVKIKIPQIVTSLGRSAFDSCPETKEIEYDGTLSQYCNLYFYSYCFGEQYVSERKLVINGIEVNNLEIPQTVTSIKGFMFSFFTSITNVQLPNTITQIGQGSFKGCKNLGSINFPNSITSILSEAFAGCALTSIVIPPLLTTLSSEVFMSNNFTSIDIPANITSISIGAFKGCSQLSEISVPFVGLTSSTGTFYNIFGDSYSAVPNSLERVIVTGETSIKQKSFYQCSHIQSVQFLSSVSSIEKQAFYECSGLESIEIPYGVSSIGEQAFYGCTGLESIEIPSHINTIGQSAFAYCSNIITVDFLHKFEDLDLSVDSNVFSGCSSLTTVNIADPATKAKFLAEYASSFVLSGKTYVLKSEVSELTEDVLSDALGYLPAESTSSPNRINLVELEASHLIGADTATSGTVQYDLQQNSTKYVQLEETPESFKQTITSFQKVFKNCTNLVGFTGIPRSVTNISEAFSGCTNLNTVEWEAL